MARTKTVKKVKKAPPVIEVIESSSSSEDKDETKNEEEGKENEDDTVLIQEEDKQDGDKMEIDGVVSPKDVQNDEQKTTQNKEEDATMGPDGKDQKMPARKQGDKSSACGEKASGTEDANEKKRKTTADELSTRQGIRLVA